MTRDPGLGPIAPSCRTSWAQTRTSPRTSPSSSRSASRGRGTKPGRVRSTCSLEASRTSCPAAAEPAAAADGSAIRGPLLSASSDGQLLCWGADQCNGSLTAARGWGDHALLAEFLTLITFDPNGAGGRGPRSTAGRHRYVGAGRRPGTSEHTGLVGRIDVRADLPQITVEHRAHRRSRRHLRAGSAAKDSTGTGTFE